MPRVFYASFMVLALVVFVVTRWLIPKPPALLVLPWWKRTALAVAAFVGGALGGKLPFLGTDPIGWLDWTTWLRDGKTIVAGLIGAYLAVELAKLLLDIRVKTGDTFALPLALALAIGRWGCFFNGCCYGVETTLPWGVWFRVKTTDGFAYQKCHPAQIYESLFHLSMALVLWQLMQRNLLPGQRLKLYLIAYGVYRFLTEYIRPEPAWWLGMTFYQWAAAALAMGMIVQWMVDRRGRNEEPMFLVALSYNGIFYGTILFRGIEGRQPFSADCEPPFFLDADVLQRIASGLKRGELEGEVDGYEWNVQDLESMIWRPCPR